MTHDAGVQNEERIAPHSPAWWAAFRAGADARCMTGLECYARARLRRGASAYCDDSPEVLASEALADVAAGLVPWTPASGPLHVTLRQRIRQNLRQQRARAVRTVRLDYLAPDDREAVEATMAATPETTEALDRIRAMPKLIAYLHAMSLDDVIVHRYLRARLDGISEVRELALVMDVTTAEVRAARKRLARLTKKANPNALAIMTALMRKAGSR